MKARKNSREESSGERSSSASSELAREPKDESPVPIHFPPTARDKVLRSAECQHTISGADRIDHRAAFPQRVHPEGVMRRAILSKNDKERYSNTWRIRRRRHAGYSGVVETRIAGSKRPKKKPPAAVTFTTGKRLPFRHNVRYNCSTPQPVELAICFGSSRLSLYLCIRNVKCKSLDFIRAEGKSLYLRPISNFPLREAIERSFDKVLLFLWYQSSRRIQGARSRSESPRLRHAMTTCSTGGRREVCGTRIWISGRDLRAVPTDCYRYRKTVVT